MLYYLEQMIGNRARKHFENLKHVVGKETVKMQDVLPLLSKHGIFTAYPKSLG